MQNTYIVGADGLAQEAAVPEGPMPQWERRVAESIATYFDNCVDPLDALRDDDTGELWLPVGTAGGTAGELVLDETRLRLIRAECRVLALENEFAINGHENRISYVVASGHTYTAAEQTGKTASDADIESVQIVVDEFVEANKWHARQQEIQHRQDRDGECFLRFFPDADGTIRVRFVEPDQVFTPTEASAVPHHSFGIITDPIDVETVEGYYVDEQLVPADEIQHRKENVDANVKRGIPLFYPVRKNLRRIEKLQRNMTVLAEIQSAIALIRKHKQATAQTVNAMVAANADAENYNASTGKTTFFRQYGPGTILDANEGTEYDFPTKAVEAGKYVIVIQSELRAVASRLVMPEFMLSSDASNANYSSTMVAEGPAVKMFERLQWGMIEDDLEVIQRALDHAVAKGRLSKAVLEVVHIVATPPTLATRNRKEEVDANMAEVTAKVMSKHTAAIRDDLDPDAEADMIKKETETIANNPWAGMGGAGQDDEDEDEEDEDGVDDDEDEENK